MNKGSNCVNDEIIQHETFYALYFFIKFIKIAKKILRNQKKMDEKLDNSKFFCDLGHPTHHMLDQLFLLQLFQKVLLLCAEAREIQ